MKDKLILALICLISLLMAAAFCWSLCSIFSASLSPTATLQAQAKDHAARIEELERVVGLKPGGKLIMGDFEKAGP